MAQNFSAAGLNADYVVGMESRGFIGAPLAYKLGIGFIPVRKAGKLPCLVHSVEYELSTAWIGWRFIKMPCNQEAGL